MHVRTKVEHQAWSRIAILGGFLALFLVLPPEGLSASGRTRVSNPYVSFKISAQWKKDEKTMDTWESPLGTQVHFWNIGNDSKNVSEAIRRDARLPRRKEISRKRFRSRAGVRVTFIRYKVVGKGTIRTSPEIWKAYFQSYRYRGIEDPPTSVANILVFTGKKMRRDRRAIRKILASLRVRSYIGGSRNIIRSRIGGSTVRFGVPRNWTIAPILNKSGPQAIAGNGAFLYAEGMNAPDLKTAEKVLRGGNALPFSGQELKRVIRRRTKSGLNVMILYGSMKSLFYKPRVMGGSRGDALTVVCFPVKKTDRHDPGIGMLVMVGDATDPRGLKEIIESIRVNPVRRR